MFSVIYEVVARRPQRSTHEKFPLTGPSYGHRRAAGCRACHSSDHMC